MKYVKEFSIPSITMTIMTIWLRMYVVHQICCTYVTMTIKKDRKNMKCDKKNSSPSISCLVLKMDSIDSCEFILVNQYLTFYPCIIKFANPVPRIILNNLRILVDTMTMYIVPGNIMLQTFSYFNLSNIIFLLFLVRCRQAHLLCM